MNMNRKRLATGACLVAAPIALAALLAAGIDSNRGAAVNPGLSRTAADIGIMPGVDPAGPIEQFPTLKVGTLNLSIGDIDTALLADARSLGAFDPESRYVIQLNGPLTPERQAALEAAGVKLGNYLPAYAYFADVRQTTPQRIAALNFVTWIGAYQNDWKVAPDLEPTVAKVGEAPKFSRQFNTAERIAMVEQGVTPVDITIFEIDTLHEVLGHLRQIGATVHGTHEIAGNPVVTATIGIDDIVGLAELASVQYVEHSPEITLRNDAVRWVVQSNQVNSYPLYERGLRGEGQIVGVLDSRLDRNHCMFHDTVPIGPGHRKIVAYHASFGASSHGTHVSGTVAGEDPAGGPNRVGVAYKGKISYNTYPSFTESAILQRLNLSQSDGARTHTNSWGDDGTTQYNGLCRGIDVFQWNNESSQTYWAATNTSSLRNPENAKNLLAVGATSKSPNHHNHCYGGAGPTNDGRRKPEIFAPGCGTVSASPGSCSTTSSGGTSMATPAVAGVGMLVRQYYMNGYYPTGEAGTGEELTPSGALIKATLLNSAVDMTGVSGYPSNQEGWGRLLADNALYFSGDTRRLHVVDVWNADGLSTGQTHEEVIHVNSGGEDLRVTVVWTDYPASAGTSFAAVNDLDLIVTGPNGTFRGNVFSGGYSVTGGSKDNRNNVEQVHIKNPGAGLWTIQVVGAAVNQQKQGFALVVTGDIDVQEPALMITLPDGAPTMLAPGAPTQFAVRITPGDENIVAGSERLYYRVNGGAFQDAALQYVGNDMYVATLPGALCGESPEFYVEAKGSGGTVRTSPANAPDSVYSADVGWIEVVDVFQENFNLGIPGNWSATGLWKATSACAVSGSCDSPQWAYYGQTTNCTYQTGSSANNGALTTPSISVPAVPAGGSVTLSFCYNLQTETSQSYDVATFSVLGGPSMQLNDSSTWTEFSMDITQFAGQNIQLRWNFDTLDGVSNDFRGWQVDGVKITAEGLACVNPEPQCVADVSGDGVVDVLDMLQVLGSWGACQGCAADINGDGAVDVMDMMEILSAWGDC